MTDESRKQEIPAPVTEGRLAYQAWTSGWMMGIGFGVLVMFVATELPNNFFDRAQLHAPCCWSCHARVRCHPATIQQSDEFTV